MNERRCAASVPDGHATTPVPPQARLAMPVQDLQAAPNAVHRAPAVTTRIARCIVFGGAALLTAFGTYQMIEVVAVSQVTVLQALLVTLFAITFGWISLSATSALAGLVPGTRRDHSTATPITARTALVMPVYNENPATTAATLEAMAESLCDAGCGDAFEVFLISDTTDPDAWIAETAAFHALRAALAGRMHVWYRRRARNVARKAGNVQEFVQCWGGRYPYMIVLDADSIMAPDTLLALVREMQSDPELGILQSVPALADGHGLFARLQQFAGCLYGPVVARGLAAWQGDDGNYWGHNAIIRVSAFAAACGLPALAGRRPFGGEILSHDFVEAALMRRAGWAVRMRPDLGGSWEASPPTLLEVAARDRRWAQGNMQHAAVLSTRGLAWPSRVHFVVGIMSYLASPLWLALIIVGLVLSLQAAIIRPEYFTNKFQLFPSWPHFDAARMIWLFVFAMIMVLVPKLIGLARALIDTDTRHACGGAVRLTVSVVIEIVLSALYAPILMMIQSRQLWEIFRGRDSGWATQRRDSDATPWPEVIRRHWLHTAAGIAVAETLAFVSLPLLAWMSPTLAGLVLAMPLSRVSGNIKAGAALRRRGLLLIPEEVSPPEVMARRDRIEPTLRDTLSRANMEALTRDATARSVHFAAVPAPPADPRGQPAPARLTAVVKLNDAADASEALHWLNRAERLAILADRSLFERILK